MRPTTARERAGALTLVALGVLVAFSSGTHGDYVPGQPAEDVDENPAPAIDALSRGHGGDFVAAHPWMGSFSLILRAPFVALARGLGGGDRLAYRLGALACVLVLAAACWFLAREMAARGRGRLTCALVAGVALLNPMTLAAIRAGHPEELLAGALSVGAALAALRGRAGMAGVMLGLAVVTKQWALVAVGPVLLAATGGHRRLAGAVAVVVVAFTLPLLAGDPDRFFDNARAAARPKSLGPASVWTPFAVERRRTYLDGTQRRTVTGHGMPERLRAIPRPLILLLPLGLAWLFWRRWGLGSEDVLALLALALLLRGALDPITNGYYYAPLVLALAAWEGLHRAGLPLVALSVALALLLTFEQVDGRGAIGLAYATWAVPLALLLALAAYAPGRLRALGVAARADPGAPRAP